MSTQLPPPAPVKPWWQRPESWRKGQAALATFVGILTSQGLLSGTAEAVTNGVVALVGTVLVIALENDTTA